MTGSEMADDVVWTTEDYSAERMLAGWAHWSGRAAFPNLGYPGACNFSIPTPRVGDKEPISDRFAFAIDDAIKRCPEATRLALCAMYLRSEWERFSEEFIIKCIREFHRAYKNG